jgi:PAS domain S-box-containing protein
MGNSLAALAEKLRQEQAGKLERLEFLVNSSPMVIYTCETHGDFAATYVSAGIKTLWGYEPEEFLSEPGFWMHRIHPEDAPKVMGEFQRLLESGRHSHEYRFRKKSGEYGWVHDELRLVRTASGEPLEIVGHCIDITKRKAAESALRESESRLALIFNSSSDLQALLRVEPGNRFIIEALNQPLINTLRANTDQDAQRAVGEGFETLLTATGLTAEEIETRRSLYCKVLEEGTPGYLQAPLMPRREAVDISVYPVRDQNHRVTHILWNGRVVTERVKAEAALHESEERYALVTEATHDGIYDWNLATGKSYLSARYKQMLGFEDSELSNELTSFFDRLHPEDTKDVQDVAARVHADPTFNHWTHELRLRCKDGSYRWVTSRGTAVRAANGEAVRIVGSVRDMTERLEAAAKLEANKKRLRDILNTLDGFVGLYSLEGVAIEINQASLVAGGFTPEDVLGKAAWETPWCDGIPEEQTRVRDAILRAAAGEAVRYEGRVHSRDGRPMIVDLTFRPLRDQDGVITHIIGFGMDITHRKEAEAELRLAQKMAESSSHAKSEFLANMSHEIRTPMNGIIGLTEVVLDSDLSAEQREYLRIVKTSAESLLMIITDILDISKLQAGKVILQSKEFWLKDALNATLKACAASAEEKSLMFTWRIEPDVPELLLGDPNCLRQVIRNVVGNAIKFTAEGEVSVTVETTPDDPGLLSFRVRDTGVGIPPDKLAAVFEPFSQADGSRRREFGGTGLGLAIAAQLVEIMGGEIWAESDGHAGSTFYFTVRMTVLPVAPMERRREGRLLTDGPVWVEILNTPALDRREARVVDISRHGMKLRAMERLEPGSILQIRMNDMTSSGEVCYCVAVAEGFLAGIKLLEV